MITVKEMISSNDFSQINHESELYMADFIRLTDCRHGVYGQYNITESGVTAKDFENAYDIASTNDVLILSDFKRSSGLSFPIKSIALVQWAKNQGGEFTLPVSFVESVLASAASAVAVEVNLNKQSNTTNHKINHSRSDILTAVINLASEKAVDSQDANSVWASLVALCSEKTPQPPLISSAGDEGIKYSANGDTKFFTKKNLTDRMRRAKTTN